VIFLTLAALLIHSPRQEEAFNPIPFLIAGLYLFTSLALWRAPLPALNTKFAQAAAYLWDVCVVTGLIYFSEGFDDEIYLMYFLIMFMGGLMTQIRQSFLIGTVSSLLYAFLWSRGKAGLGLPLTNLLLRFSFFYVVAFFTAVMAERVRVNESKVRRLELRFALARIGNGGWGIELDDDLGPALDPDLAKTVRTVNALVDNLSFALKRTVNQNEELRVVATEALRRLAEEKERLDASSRGERSV
jgi:hypothetical protein